MDDKDASFLPTFPSFWERRLWWNFVLFFLGAASCGLVLDFAQSEVDWLPRFGAIIVAVMGYALAVDPRHRRQWFVMVKAEIDEERWVVSEPMRDAELISKIEKSRGNFEVAEKTKNQAFRKTKPKLQDLTVKRNVIETQARCTCRAQIWCLVGGTLLWAFGDLAVNLVLKCGKLACS